MSKDKETVRNYYDSYGWRKDATGYYQDVARWVDIRPVAGPYWRKANLRIAHFFGRGRYFLYAGSGVGGSSSQLAFSSGYTRRVCVDISHTALQEARSRIQDEGWYVQADLARLPFRDGVFDAMLSPFVLYHVPRDEQETVLMELYRTLNDPGVCVIIYDQFKGLSRYLRVPGARRLGRLGTQILKRIRPTRKSAQLVPESSLPSVNEPPPLYSHAHNRRWFQETLPQQWNADIRCFATADSSFSKRFAPDNLVGQSVLRLIYWLESTFPYALAWVGLQTIVIRKPSWD